MHMFCSERKTRYGVHDRPRLRSASTAEISRLPFRAQNSINHILGQTT